MKVINDLVVVEVPKGCGYSISGTELWLDDDGVNIDTIELPFPCTIIGTLDDLANSSAKKDEVINAAKHTNGILTSLLITHGIISMTPDINKPERQLLFLKCI